MSKDLKNKLADSSNYGGILMPLSSVDSKKLKGMIRLCQSNVNIPRKNGGFS